MGRSRGFAKSNDDGDCLGNKKRKRFKKGIIICFTGGKYQGKEVEGANSTEKRSLRKKRGNHTEKFKNTVGNEDNPRTRRKGTGVLEGQGTGGKRKIENHNCGG